MERIAGVAVTGKPFEKFVQVCQRNAWVKINGVDFKDGLSVESDYPYYLERYEDIDVLVAFFKHGNWGLRSAVQYKDQLIFVQQVNGGDEWWTIKIDGDELVPFESMSCARMIETGTFLNTINKMCSATAEQCRQLEYCS